jgi:hypothetical protein
MSAIPAVNTVLANANMGQVRTPNDLFLVAQNSAALQALVDSMPGTYMNMSSLIAVQNALRNDMNAQLVEELYGVPLIGEFAGPAPKSLPALSVDIITTANGALVYKGFQDIIFEYKKAMQTGTPIAVGFNLLERALASFTDYCCNTMGAGGNVSSLDPTRKAGQFNMHYYADQQINEVALGASSTEDFIVYAPGALKLFTRNEFTGKRARKMGTVTRGTIGDVRVPGLEWDFAVSEDGCAEVVTFNLGIMFGLWGRLPANTYQVGDNLEGVNGVFHFQANAI